MLPSKSKGVVLLVVLIFLQIFSIMGLYGLTTVAVIMKLNRDLWQREVNLTRAKTILSDISLDEASCIIPITPPSELAKQPLTWWQTTACSGNSAENPYYYVIESLGKDACGVVEVDNQRYVAAYSRITLRFATVILQATYAKASEEIASCKQTHHVLAGYQMWREI